MERVKTRKIKLIVHTSLGQQLLGHMHVPEDYDASLRTSDILNRHKQLYLLLTDVNVYPLDRSVDPYQCETAMVNVSNIVMIELPPVETDDSLSRIMTRRER